MAHTITHIQRSARPGLYRVRLSDGRTGLMDGGELSRRGYDLSDGGQMGFPWDSLISGASSVLTGVFGGGGGGGGYDAGDVQAAQQEAVRTTTAQFQERLDEQQKQFEDALEKQQAAYQKQQEEAARTQTYLLAAGAGVALIGGGLYLTRD